MATFKRKIKKVAVTGSGGFIGSHLTEALLARGCDVTAIVRTNARSQIGHLQSIPVSLNDRLTICRSDIQDSDDLLSHLQGADTILHLAAQISVPYSRQAPSLFLKTNLEGTHNVLDVSRRLRVERVVIVSTSEVYGTARSVPITEDHLLCSHSPYAASKIAAEKLAESYYYSYGLGVVVVRPFNTYGPRQSFRAVIPWIIKQALNGSTISLGNVDPVRDFVFVKDTVAGMIAAAEADGVEGETFNLATGNGVRIGSVVAEVSKIIGRELTIVSNDDRTRPNKFEVWKLIGSTEKAANRLGWQSSQTLRTGLEIMVDYMSKNEDTDGL